MQKKTSPKLELINFTKNTTSDNNILYTIIYRNNPYPNLTKILCNRNGDILAYIDIQQQKGLQQRFHAQFKTLWPGIQEWHPELIGDFKTVLEHDYLELRGLPMMLSLFYPGHWIHDSKNHLYTFIHYSRGFTPDWFRVNSEPENDGTIETNFHIFDKNDTRTYEYNTHPLAPTPKIELLTKFILYKDGVITKKQFDKYTHERKRQRRHDASKEKIQTIMKKFAGTKTGIQKKLQQLVHSEQM